MTKIASKTVIPVKTNEKDFLLIRLPKQHVKMVECLHKHGEGMVLSPETDLLPPGVSSVTGWDISLHSSLAGRQGEIWGREGAKGARSNPPSPSNSNTCHTGCFHSIQTILDFQFGPKRLVS